MRKCARLSSRDAAGDKQSARFGASSAPGRTRRAESETPAMHPCRRTSVQRRVIVGVEHRLRSERLDEGEMLGSDGDSDDPHHTTEWR